MVAINLTAYSHGLDARYQDEDTGELTDNPYSPGSQAAQDWYEGYNAANKRIESRPEPIDEDSFV